MTRKIKISIWFCLFVLSLFFWRVDASKAFLGSAECASKGGSCDFTCFSSDYESLGMCDYGMAICCRKKLADTSGADPDPMGVGNSQAGGTVATGTSGVTDSNAGLGGAQGGTVTPGTSGISATSSTAANTATTTSSGNENTGGLVPCKNNCTLCHLVIGIKNIFEYLVYTVLFPLFTLGIVISGVLYMVSSGNKGLTEKAKTALTYSLMGAVVALTSWLLVNATLYAIGYKSVGSWSNFTCDTTQSAPQISTPGGGTLPSGSGNTAGGDGTCGGVSVAQNSNQCQYASREMENVLACIRSRTSGSSASGNNFWGGHILFSEAQAASSLSISSLGQNQNGGNWQACVGTNWNSANCPHVQYSCHYGGRTCQGQINAADLTGSNMSEIAAAARACNASGTVLYGDEDHTRHVHVSVNNSACGCDSNR